MQFTLSFRTPIFLNMDTAKSNAVYQKYFDHSGDNDFTNLISVASEIISSL